MSRSKPQPLSLFLLLSLSLCFVNAHLCVSSVFLKAQSAMCWVWLCVLSQHKLYPCTRAVASVCVHGGRAHHLGSCLSASPSHAASTRQCLWGCDPDILPETSSLHRTKLPTFPPEWQSCFFETLPAPGLIDLPVSIFPVPHCSPVTGDLLSSTYEIK